MCEFRCEIKTTDAQRRRRVARQKIFHPEDRARITIDGQLAEAGWLVQSREEVNRSAGPGIAVREFPTASGPVDYALFVGGTLCGVVEAKPEGTTLSGFADQAARYLGSVPEHLVGREGQLRFEYVASGTEILFRDYADPAPRSRRVFFFHRPETLRRWLGEPMTIRRRLQSMPPLLTERLRDCQIDAVTNLEASLAADHPRALIQMATGAGKTYTACVFGHRLLEHAKFRRVLFLADRANLVRQTRHEFEDFRPPGTGRSFTELYNVQRLVPAGLDQDASVVIATIQRVYSMLTGRELSGEDEERSGFETGASEPQRLVHYTTEFHVLRPEAVEPRYLWYWLVRHAFRHEAERNMSGSAGQLRVPVDYLRKSPISVAPLAEQRRIVARIDELFAEIAEGEAALQRARQGLDTWRRALLKAAVTGELTRDWRDANRPAETGADLLARIRAERGSWGQKVLRGRRGITSAPLDASALPLLPEGWVWAQLGDLGEIVGGVTVDKKRKPADPVEVPYLRVANVQRGYIDLSEVKKIRVDRSVAGSLELRADDILLNEGGDRDKIGRGWVWQGELPICIHQNHVFRVRPHHNSINPFFVSHYANEIGRTFFIEKGKQTTSLASISLSKISELPVPVPPAAEAEIIIDRLRGALVSGADNNRDISEARELSSAIRQSILKTAFEGQLVPQDPTDESASALLARMRNGYPNNGARGRRARAVVGDSSHPSLPGLARQSGDPRVEPTGDD